MKALARLSLLVASVAAVDARPNIVFILADDLNADWKNDRLSYMPHLRKRFSERGAFFENHIAAVPVCGPSRSSLLVGRYPHNNGYLANDDLDSVDAFCGRFAAQGANNSIGRWLRDAGYHTAFLGKYVNSCEHYVPYGWSHWGGFIQTYDFYNATMYDMDWEDDGAEPEIKTRGMEGVHQADFLGNMTLEHAKKAVSQGKPFFVHVTPVMPHWGTCYGPGPASVYGPLDPHWEMSGVKDETGKSYSLPISPCPTDRHRHAFDDQLNPHIEDIWNVSIVGLRPQHMADTEKNGVNAFQALREDLGWRNRSASLLDLDDMIGEIIDGLEELDVLDNTYVFFSSDNGYHLGEHKMVFGKGLPYETDVRLPMYVLGPTVKPNTTMYHPTTHLDISATIVELAGATPGSQLDGKSFAQELGGGDAGAWRQFAYSEFFTNDATWRLVRQANSTHTFSHARWCQEHNVEIFDFRTDPWQTSNLAGQVGLPEQISAQFDPISTALASCAGASCSSPVPSLGADHDFECYYPIQGKQALQGSFGFHTNSKTGTVDAISGWALDFHQDGPGTPHPRGFSSLEVRLRMDGKFVSGFQQIAHITRNDLNKSTGIFARFPNLEHGFHFDLAGLPDKAYVGRRQFDVRQVVRDPVTQQIMQLKDISKPQKLQCLYDGKPGACESLLV